MLLKKYVVFALLIFSVCFGQNNYQFEKQRDVKMIYKKLFFKSDSLRNRKHRKLVFSLLPAPANGDGQNGLLISFLTTFYLGEDRENTKISEVSFAPYFSFTGQYVFPIRSYIYTRNDRFNFIGDYRYLIYPEPTYGLGSNNLKEQQSILDYKQWRFYQFATRKIQGDFRLGLGLQMDSYQDISEYETTVPVTDFSNYMKGDYSDNNSFGVSVQALFDTRKNTINPEQGYYLETNIRMNSTAFGSDENWNSLYIDARKYYSFSKTKHRVLASRAFWWNTFGGDPHYLDLPSIGSDRYGKTGRGFTRNRFRSTALLYFETEYRTDITQDGFVGAVAFANISSVSNLNTYHFRNFHPAIGTGLRLKWDKRNNTNLALDFGVSKNDWSLRFGLSENF